MRSEAQQSPGHPTNFLRQIKRVCCQHGLPRTMQGCHGRKLVYVILFRSPTTNIHALTLRDYFRECHLVPASNLHEMNSLPTVILP